MDSSTTQSKRRINPLDFRRTLAVYLRNVKEIQYIPQQGNAGDQVQLAGLQRFLRENEITIVDDAPTIVVAGGGWLTPHYPKLHKTLARLIGTEKRMIVLPSTVIGVGACTLLRSFKDLVLMAREETSYREVLTYGISALLVQDAAFGLNYSEWDKQETKNRSELLIAFREDRESIQPKTFPANEDISAKYHTAYEFIRRINEFRVVHTDRAHVAIVATLLGKNVHFHPNATHKNESIYISLLSTYSNIHFYEQKEPTA